VVPKAKHDSLNTHDLMGYDNVSIDSVEAVVSLLGRWVCQKNTCSGARNKFVWGHEKELLNGKHTHVCLVDMNCKVCELLY
jgi:hypothetical protein